MTLGVAEIERWDAGAVRLVFRAALARAASAEHASSALAELPVFAAWAGFAADAARAAIGRTRLGLDAHASEALVVARAAEQAAHGIEKVQRELRQLQDDAYLARLRIDPETSTVTGGSGFGGLVTGGLGFAGITPTATLITAFQAGLNAIIAEADAVDGELARAITIADGGGPIPDTAPMAALPPRPEDPSDVNRWWNSLTPPQRDFVLYDRSAEIGNLNGIPVIARDHANQRVMRQDLATVREAARRAGVLMEEVADDPARYALSDGDITRFRNAVQTEAGLRHNTGARGANPTYLLAYDPAAFGGEGRAAIAIGNPDEAANTAVIVPGTGSSVRSGWLSAGHDDALHLFEQAAAAEPTRLTAVVAWMGYDAPNAFADPRVATPWLARAGGQSLARDVDALALTHTGGPGRITVLGHSYGSTTVADAAALGMRADDVVLLGCPGTDMARSASDFRLTGNGHVYVGGASTDPVGWLGVSPTATALASAALGHPLGPLPGLGTDPAAQSFGAVRFAAEVTGSDGLDVGDHSHYYAVGSESLRAMTAIATGHGDRLGTGDLLAEGRHAPSVSTPGHLELPWVGRVDLPQIVIPIPGLPEIIDPESSRPNPAAPDR